MICFQFLDNIIETMNDRLNQQCLQLYVTVEDIILSSANNATKTDTDSCITAICKHCGSDLEERKLRLNLEMLNELMDGKVAERLSDVTDQLNSLGPARRL